MPRDHDTTARPPTPPRLACLLAAKAPLVLVFRRGPSAWFHLLRWRLDDGVLEPGAWVRKKLFPERCDFSPDGEFVLFYIAGSYEKGYQVFGGVSRAPWLAPLVSWDERGTWGRGTCFFEEGTTLHTWGPTRDAGLPGVPLSVCRNDTISFANERRRGWVEAPNCPARAPDDTWDERRRVVLQKASPAGLLRLSGMGFERGRREYEIELPSGRRLALGEAVWADWDHRGRLLMATEAGALRMEELRGEERVVVQAHDLAGLTPDPQPAPAWAATARNR